MTPPLARTVLQMLDLSEQPPTPYVFFPPAEHRAPIAIDTWEVDDGMVYGKQRMEGILTAVVSMPADKGWVVYHRSLLREMTTEDSIREAAARATAAMELERELAPGGAEDGDLPAGRVIVFPNGPRALGTGEADDVRPNPGQYI